MTMKVYLTPDDAEHMAEAATCVRDELLDWEIFTTLEEAKILIEQWRKEYNQIRPHSAKNYRPPAPETIITMATT